MMFLHKVTLKAFHDFKNRQQKCMKYCFSNMQKYVNSESVFNRQI